MGTSESPVARLKKGKGRRQALHRLRWASGSSGASSTETASQDGPADLRWSRLDERCIAFGDSTDAVRTFHLRTRGGTAVTVPIDIDVDVDWNSQDEPGMH